MFGHLFLDGLDVDRVAAFLVQHFAQQTFHHLQGQFLARERGEGGDADQRAFQAADVGADAVARKLMISSGNSTPMALFLFAQDGHARFDVRRLHFRDQTPLKAGNQPLLQVLDFGGGPVAGQDDLLVRLVQGVEGVEEFLLNALLAGQKLDVVNQQHVRLPVFAAEADQLVVLDGVDVFVGEFLGGKIRDARAFSAARRRAGRWRAANGSCPSPRRRRRNRGL